MYVCTDMYNKYMIMHTPSLFWPMLIKRAVKLLLEHIHTVVKYIAPHLV